MELKSPTHPLNKKRRFLKKKYGGTIPKKSSLISKELEHAYFDSADWALGM